MLFKIKLIWNYIKGEIWCRNIHKKLMSSAPGFGGRDVFGRRQKRYTPILCPICNNQWETKRNLVWVKKAKEMGKGNLSPYPIYWNSSGGFYEIEV